MVLVDVEVEVEVEVVDVVSSQTRSDVAVGAATSIWLEVHSAKIPMHSRSEVSVGAVDS